MLRFAGRVVTSTNQYKNILGIFPKEWRVPISIRRANQQYEMLVRLMGNMATEKEVQTSGSDPKPIPLPAPVTMQTLPVRSKSPLTSWLRHG